jgi:GGDEF domain-containing protein
MMVSIRNSLSELEKCHQDRILTLDSYVAAIKNVSQYTIEVDPQLAAKQKGYLDELSCVVAGGSSDALLESQSTLRGLLRDYRDKVSAFLSNLREELAGTTRALEEILDSLSQTDGEHEVRLRAALKSIRQFAAAADATAGRDILVSAAGAIEDSLEQMRKQHQLAVAQFQVEIRMLHKRIDALEAASSIDQLTRLFNRAEIEQRIRAATEPYCLLAVRVNGFRLAEVRFNVDAAAELAAAFAKRFRNSLPPTAAIGRWANEEFVALLPMNKSDAIALAKWVSEHLSGAYSCIQSGKSVRPTLQLTTAVVDSSDSAPDHVLERVSAFLPGQ